MEERTRTLSRRSFLGGAAAFGFVSVATPSLALAKTSAEVKAQADAERKKLVRLQADLEEASEDRYKAQQAHKKATAAVKKCQKKIDEAKARIAELQDKLGTRARTMYRNGGASTFLDLLLGAESFEQFATNWDILSDLNEQDAAMVSETKELKAEIEAQKVELKKQEKIAAEKEAEAKAIEKKVAKKTAEAQRIVAALDKEAKKLLEEEQAAAAREAARKREEEERRRQQQNGGGGSKPSDPGPGSDGSKYPTHPGAASYAHSKIGCKYVWGAEGPNTFDCSGLVKWSYAQIGMSVPHQSESLKACAKAVMPISKCARGDVLWRYGHVGIAEAAGGVPYVHAPTFGARVRNTDGLSWSGFTAALRM